MGLIHAAGKHDSADSMLREGVAVAAAEGLRQFPGKTQFFRRPAEIFHGSLLFPGVIGHQIDGNLVLQRAA